MEALLKDKEIENAELNKKIDELRERIKKYAEAI